jgi:hypothetical protein
MRRRYDPSNYDEHFCLKPPLLLWLALVYLSRAITLPLAVQISSLAGGSADTTALIRGAFSAYSLLPSLIAAVVFVALIRRSPSGSRAARWIWARGRILLATSAILDLGLSFVDPQSGHGGASGAIEARVLTAAFDLYFLVYILAAGRVRDAFAAFPAPADRASV